MDIDTYMRAARGENVGTHISWPQIGRQLAAEIDDLRAHIDELKEEKRQLAVGFEAVNAALATSRLSSGGGH